MSDLTRLTNIWNFYSEYKFIYFVVGTDIYAFRLAPFLQNNRIRLIEIETLPLNIALYTV